jgi:hypothetical protein
MNAYHEDGKLLRPKVPKEITEPNKPTKDIKDNNTYYSILQPVIHPMKLA